MNNIAPSRPIQGETEHLAKRPAQDSTCAWQRMPQEQRGWWHSACGEERYWEDALMPEGPSGGGWRYCPFCSGRLV